MQPSLPVSAKKGGASEPEEEDVNPVERRPGGTLSPQD